ncbi:MAG: hypothetical protein Q7S85_09560, partial [Rugosibacter sp.]|nr:hypothetical protein [Rugosibacter sp.]
AAWLRTTASSQPWPKCSQQSNNASTAGDNPIRCCVDYAALFKTLCLDSDSNKSRWPTHPLWEIITNASWGDATQPAMQRIRASNLPTDDRLFTAGLGYVSAFMGREGITDMSQGFGEFLHQADTYHRLRGESTARYVERKARVKGRLFSTINNRAHLDRIESLRRAEAYRKAREGEE